MVQCQIQLSKSPPALLSTVHTGGTSTLLLLLYSLILAHIPLPLSSGAMTFLGTLFMALWSGQRILCNPDPNSEPGPGNYLGIWCAYQRILASGEEHALFLEDPSPTPSPSPILTHVLYLPVR